MKFITRNRFIWSVPLLAAAFMTPMTTDAKLLLKEFTFDGSELTFSSGTTASATIGGEVWNVLCTSGTIAGNGYVPLQKPEGIENAQRIVIPKSGYLCLSTECLKGKDIKSVKVEVWNTSGSAFTSLNVQNQYAFGTVLDAMTPESQSLQSSTLFSGAIAFTDWKQNHSVIEDIFRLYFKNESLQSVEIGISKISVIYDDGVAMPISFMIDGEVAEDGCTVLPGSILTVDTGDATNPVITYTIGDSTSDDRFPTEGLTLSKPGTYIYHLTAKADDYTKVTADFTVTVEGENEVETDTVDFTTNATEKYGLTLFDSDSIDYETECTEWSEGEIQFRFEEGEPIRLEQTEDGSTMLMLAPYAELQVGVTEESYKILKAEINGLNTDYLEITILEGGEEESARRMAKRAASWDAQGTHATSLLITNTGSAKAGISSLALDIDKGLATRAESLLEDSISIEYFDINGRRLPSRPSSGLYIEKSGTASRLLIVR